MSNCSPSPNDIPVLLPLEVDEDNKTVIEIPVDDQTYLQSNMKNCSLQFYYPANDGDDNIIIDEIHGLGKSSA